MNEFIWPVRVYHEDTDGGGVVYYANYLKFMERARTEWLRSLGVEQDELLHKQGMLFVVRALTLDYRYPARFNDLLQVRSRIAEQRGASVVLEQQIRRTTPEQLLCAGRVKVACIDAQTFKPKPLPRIFDGDRR